MKAVFSAFKRYFAGILDDYMLVACVLMPVIMGAAFRFGIPPLEAFLCDTFSQSAILMPYYLIFDLLIAVMTPVMFSFSGVMTVLEELDNGTARYLMVTPIGRSGYLFSRIGIPSVAGVLYSVVALMVFGLSGISLAMNVTVSLMCCFTGIIVSVLVITLAGNKVEGMALIKLSGIIVLGIPAAYFLPQPIVYMSAVLPSYWFTVMARSGNYLYALPTLAVSALWIAALYRGFSKKLL